MKRFMFLWVLTMGVLVLTTTSSGTQRVVLAELIAHIG